MSADLRDGPGYGSGVDCRRLQAVKDPVEGAEDSEELGAADLEAAGVNAGDVVIGIAASGRTPYVLGAMKRAGELGAAVFGICNNHGTPMSQTGFPVIEAVVGPEVVMGSTRMKSGTAQADPQYADHHRHDPDREGVPQSDG